MDMILGREAAIVLNFEQYSTTGGLRRVKRQPETATRSGNEKWQPEAAKSRKQRSVNRRRNWAIQGLRDLNRFEREFLL
ncbi:MAG: hypothetical protein ABSG91_10530 [Syntrophobacteraceae bacterium]|jgi:hypothetical protein